jgi:hypothetical protein
VSPWLFGAALAAAAALLIIIIIIIIILLPIKPYYPAALLHTHQP